MNIVNEKESGQLQELKIEIVKGDYFDKIEDALKKQRKKVMVPGFRQGNAPMGMVRKMYYKSLLADQINNMVGEALYGYLRDNKLDILLEPLPVNEKSNVDFDNNEDFTFTFEFALQPDFDLSLDQMPILTTFKVQAAPQEKEDYISQLRKRHGKYTNPETIEFEDDYVTLQYGEEKTGFFNSSDLNDEGRKVFENKKLNDDFEVSLKAIFKDDATLARFLKIEEKDIDKDASYTYTVKISSIGRIEMAELKEDFFKTAFPDGKVKNKKELDAHVAEEIEKRWKDETDRHFMNEAIGLLLENIQIDMPDDFIKRYLLATQENMTSESLEEKYDDLLKSFKWQLIENKIVKENELSVTEAEVKEYIRNFFIANYFAQFNPEDVAERLDSLVVDAIKNKEDVKRIYDTLFDKKVEGVLRSRLRLEEKTGDFQDFVSFVTGKKPEEAKGTKKKAATPKVKESKETKPAKTKEKKTEELTENEQEVPKKKATAKKNDKK